MNYLSPSLKSCLQYNTNNTRELFLVVNILFAGVLCLSLFCYALLCVHSSFEIILKRKRKLVTWVSLSYRCIVTVNALWLLLTVPLVGLQCVIVVFPYYIHLLFCIQCYILN